MPLCQACQDSSRGIFAVRGQSLCTLKGQTSRVKTGLTPLRLRVPRSWLPARGRLSHGAVTAAHPACSTLWLSPLKEQLVLEDQERLQRISVSMKQKSCTALRYLEEETMVELLKSENGCQLLRSRMVIQLSGTVAV